ncbi:MAG: aspartate/tyrosine/aromatic aminotransferase, partial [Phycisphaerales bacterium]|nr:aspartate/tyrosine/aromatic aminotransferase [Phycisphaerales bacterium]
MFANITLAPPDSILGLAEAFKKDPRPQKINLSVGVYCDETGKTPVLPSVKEAERRLLTGETSKSYLPIDGSPQFGQLVQQMIFGSGHEVISSKRVATAHTPSGTAALRVAADFIKKNLPSASVWMSDPTWPNHPQIFQAAGLTCKNYPYFDSSSNSLAFDKMLAGLATIPAGDVVLLHGCCHNPSGIDPTPQQWQAVAKVLGERQVLPLIDFAYQGFGQGIDEDAAGVRELVKSNPEVLIASSYSKNFGLYNERVGALTMVGADADAATRVL